MSSKRCVSIVVGGALAVLVAAFMLHQHGSVPQATVAAPSQTAGAEPSNDETTPHMVLWWIESTPADARVVNVTKGRLLGTTPETFEFERSKALVTLRIEKKGYKSVVREIRPAADSTLSVALELDPSGTSPSVQ